MDRENLDQIVVESDVNAVPANFPRPRLLAAVPGAQPNPIVVKYEGRFYQPGCTPPEIYERWDYCEHIGLPLRMKSPTYKSGTNRSVSASTASSNAILGWIQASATR